jgi:DNA-directed RNA polymerase specialized sigma24 family protein
MTGVQEQRRAAPAELNALRHTADATLDDLLAASTALRRELLGWERALKRMLRHLQRGRETGDVHKLMSIAEHRLTLQRALERFETKRHVSRRAIFVLAAAEGRSLADIARDWGVSRQLVSRIIHEDAPLPPAH